MSKKQRGVRDRTGPFKGSYQESIDGGMKEQCYKDDKDEKIKDVKHKWWEK